MNRFLPYILALSFLTSCVATEAMAQMTPVNTKCSNKSALAWDMDSVEDLSKFTVYISRTPIDPTENNSALTKVDIPYSVTDNPPDENGSVTIEEPLMASLANGEQYFGVTASDAATTPNESPMSDTIGCMYKFIPGKPFNFRIIVTVPPGQ